MRAAKAIVRALCWGGLLAGCAVRPVAVTPVPAQAGHWVAPVPHEGKTANLAAWWSRFDDPNVAELVAMAERDSPTLDEAAARIRQTRALMRQAGAARIPSATANSQVTRSYSPVTVPSGAQTYESITTDASWEVDLFGRVRATAAAADARARASELRWHEARVSLAAEVANEYLNYRACEALVSVYRQDAASQGKTAELTRTKVRAGFETPSNGALAAASAADAATRLATQQADCDLSVKALVYLTGAEEPDLRARWAAGSGRLPQPEGIEVGEIPAAAIAQRPDLAAVERDLAATLADVDVALADRYPRLTLTGSVGYAYGRFLGVGQDGKSWSFGPALSFPLFDAGRRAAAVDEARGRFDEAAAKYRASAKQAVREVEEALVRLDAAGRREEGASRAAAGYREFFDAAEKRWRVGTGSLLDLEQARRNALSADATLIQVRRDRVAAWIALYKALGGGWNASAPIASNVGRDGQ